MIVLYILAGIVLFFALLFSLHIKFYLKINTITEIYAGFGPVVLKLAPKKPAKQIKLKDFTYEKHQKRLQRDRKAAQKKAEKKQLKDEKKKMKAAEALEAEKAAAKIENAAEEEKLVSVIDILTLVFDELPKLASYFKTEIRLLDITVGGRDADRIGRTYGKMSILVPLLIELLENKTDFKKLKPNAVRLNADFTAEKTKIRLHIRLKLQLFSIIRIGWHALVWFIKLKMKQAKQA